MKIVKNMFLNAILKKANEILEKDGITENSVSFWRSRYRRINDLYQHQYMRFRANESFFNNIHVILNDIDFSDMELENGKTSFTIEFENMLFEAECYEGNINENICFYDDEKEEETFYELSEDQKTIITDYMKECLKEFRQEASMWTGDPWKDNGVSKRDFYGI